MVLRARAAAALARVLAASSAFAVTVGTAALSSALARARAGPTRFWTGSLCHTFDAPALICS